MPQNQNERWIKPEEKDLTGVGMAGAALGVALTYAFYKAKEKKYAGKTEEEADKMRAENKAINKLGRQMFVVMLIISLLVSTIGVIIYELG